MISEFLRYCSQLPYNSCYPDLPDWYRQNLHWGLDCYGFAHLALDRFPDSKIITGVYGNGMVHAAALVENQFVDPFLRLAQPLTLKNDQWTEAPTFYEGSTVRGYMDSSTSILQIELMKGNRTIKPYVFYESNQVVVRMPVAYRFSVLHDGRPMIIEKRTSIRGQVRTQICGASESDAEAILQESYGFGLTEVSQMFIDAGQNSNYQRALAR
jgi:hypothetical protein